MKRLLIILIFLGMAGSAGAMDLAPGECIDVHTYNTTHPLNLSYYTFSTVTICAEEMNLTEIVDEHNLNQSCYIRDIVNANTSYNNSLFPCDVIINTTEMFCPACPIIPEREKCTITDNIYPMVGNSSKYENSTDYCEINLTIAHCEECDVFQMPGNYSLVENERMARLTDTAEKGIQASGLAIECFESLTDEKVARSECERLKRGVCPIGSEAILSGWERLSNFERAHLDKFSRLNVSVNMWEFADVAFPFEEDKQESTWWSGIMLEDYAMVGFASTICETVYYEGYGVNRTECSYFPIINEYCMNETAGLVKIKQTGEVSGQIGTLAGGITLMLLIFAGFFLDGRAPVVPYR